MFWDILNSDIIKGAPLMWLCSRKPFEVMSVLSPYSAAKVWQAQGPISLSYALYYETIQRVRYLFLWLRQKSENLGFTIRTFKKIKKHGWVVMWFILTGLYSKSAVYKLSWNLGWYLNHFSYRYPV